MLNQQEKRELLKLARAAIQSYLTDRSFIPVEPLGAGGNQKGGAFVTLEKGGELRGCIGHLAADRPLALVVQEMAIAAATSDPRFPAVRASEIPSLKIEISVLSDFRRIRKTTEIVVGIHGLIISGSGKRGILLPQVAREQKWDVPTFLSATCRKAGLPPDAWKKGASVEVFTAEVFSE